MNFFEKIVYWLQGEMERPNPYGWFHLMWIGFTILSLVVLYSRKKYYGEKQLKKVLFTYGFIAFILELTKQIIWSFNYDPITNIGTWDYQWYAAPFQLCTTPIFVALICAFLKKGNVRKSLLSYMAYITILGGLMTILIPDSCFVETIEVNIHTMWLHCGSFVVSVYLLMMGEVEVDLKNIKKASYVFLVFVFIAQLLNFGIYHSGLLNGEEFNMFYISPYFESSLPVYSFVQTKIPFFLFFLFYISTVILGGLIIYLLCHVIKIVIRK